MLKKIIAYLFPVTELDRRGLASTVAGSRMESESGIATKYEW